MPRIIRRTLAERLLKSPLAGAVLRDFSCATGVPLRFANPLGAEIPIEGTRPEPAVCVWMRSDPARARLCGQTIQEGILQAEGGRMCGGQCVAGLREAAVPLKLGGEIFGYLLAGQVAPRPLDVPGLNRWRHALERAGQMVPSDELKALATTARVMDDERFGAAVRLLERSALQIAGQMEEHLTRPAPELSPPIRKACTFIRSHFSQPLTLKQVATEAGMSREHFCTMFHKGTGLRFVDYLTRVRIERATELLRDTSATITDIALSCGFQSISHFNRRFAAVVGETPSANRRRSQAARSIAAS